MTKQDSVRFNKLTMKQHANATLTVAQRITVKLLFDNQGLSKSELARHFGVHRRTIAKWVNRDSPLDKTSETRKKQMVTPNYEQAVIEYRKANPTFGAIPIALALKEKFSSANRGTVALILKAQGLTKK
jgi:transposase